MSEISLLLGLVGFSPKPEADLEFPFVRVCFLTCPHHAFVRVTRRCFSTGVCRAWSQGLLPVEINISVAYLLPKPRKHLKLQ